MKKNAIGAFLLIAMMLCSACGAKGDAQASPSLSPSPTPSPVVTMEPTPTPNLPEANPSLPAFADVCALRWDEWPTSCRMRFRHASGNTVEANGLLTQGESFTVYLLNGLKERSYEQFVLVGGRIVPARTARLDTGEGIEITATDASVADALSQSIAAAEEQDYTLTARHDIAEWAAMYGFDMEPERGAIPYPGEFAIMQDNGNNVRRMFALDTLGGTRQIVMQVYEPTLGEPPMFHYLCSMLASIRFQ